MPIYAYRCESCGHARDVLQKVSDPLLTVCPACGAPTFRKQVTAAGFKLKGSGWYATDFKGGGAPAAGANDANDGKGAQDANEGKAGDKDKPAAAPAPAAADTASTSATAPGTATPSSKPQAG